MPKFSSSSPVVVDSSRANRANQRARARARERQATITLPITDTVDKMRSMKDQFVRHKGEACAQGRSNPIATAMSTATMGEAKSLIVGARLSSLSYYARLAIVALIGVCVFIETTGMILGEGILAAPHTHLRKMGTAVAGSTPRYNNLSMFGENWNEDTSVSAKDTWRIILDPDIPLTRRGGMAGVTAIFVVLMGVAAADSMTVLLTERKYCKSPVLWPWDFFAITPQSVGMALLPLVNAKIMFSGIIMTMHFLDLVLRIFVDGMGATEIYGELQKLIGGMLKGLAGAFQALRESNLRDIHSMDVVYGQSRSVQALKPTPEEAHTSIIGLMVVISLGYLFWPTGGTKTL
jgi:hypothetical protein